MTAAKPVPPTLGVGATMVAFSAFALTAAPNLILLAIADRSPFWVVQTVTSLILVFTPALLGCRVSTALWILSPFAAFMPFAAAYALATGFPPSPMAAEVLREATREELLNFLPQLLTAAGVSVAILALYYVLIRRIGYGRVAVPKSVRLLVLGLLLCSLTKDFVAGGLRNGSTVLLARLEKMHPVAPLAIEVGRFIEGGAVPDRTKLLGQFHVVQQPANTDREICVLVIGESARKRAFGLYNPALDTTPRLKERGVVALTDMTACATVTFQSVPILLTGRMPAPNEMLPYSELGLVDAYRIAGFKTAWLSAQQADGEINSLVTSFTTNAEQKTYVNGRLDRSKYREHWAYDDSALLGPFDTLLASNTRKLFIVLHTLGSHAQYVQRYPAKFEKWPVDPGTRSAMRRWLPPYDADQRRQIDAAYLNTIYFTDWFVDEVIARLEKTGAVSTLLYVSDHGENDASAPLMPAAHAVPTPDVVNLPAFVWFSKPYRTARPQVPEALERNAAKHSSELDLCPTMLDFFDLKTDAMDPTRSLARPEYAEHFRPVLLMDGKTISAADVR